MREMLKNKIEALYGDIINSKTVVERVPLVYRYYELYDIAIASNLFSPEEVDQIEKDVIAGKDGKMQML